MEKEEEYFKMIDDTSKLIAKEKANFLGSTATAFNESNKLVNEVEFWRWMGANYPKDLSSLSLIQETAINKSKWLATQLQGKGYEWDYMTMQRGKLSKIFSVFDAGDSPTQAGIDITEKGLFNNSVNATYQNKAYVSSNKPNLSNTPKDAIVVTNKENILYSQKQGYKTEQYMDGDEIKSVRDARLNKASSGTVNCKYTLKNVAVTSVKAGVISAVIGMTTEVVSLYKLWKNKEITDEEYLKEVLKAGGDAGVTGGLVAAAMVPVQAAITTAGASSLIAIPVMFVFGKSINSVVAPCFGRGKYREILNEARYYQEIEDVYDDFVIAVENASNQYTDYINHMRLQNERHSQMKEISTTMNKSLKDLYDSI